MRRFVRSRRHRRCAANQVVIGPITRSSQEVVSPNDRAHRSPPRGPLPTGSGFFCAPRGPLPGTSANSFPYSISGFIAEPSQSAQRPRANPAAVQSGRHGLPRGTTVCVLFCEGIRATRIPSSTRGALQRVKRRRRPRSYFSSPRRLAVEDIGLSIRATPVRIRPGRPISAPPNFILGIRGANSFP